MAKKKFYAYSVGGSSGIADNWPACEKIVSGRPEAKFKGFESEEAAKLWLEAGADYSIKNLAAEKGIYFDAGTGAGRGVEINVADEKGKSLLGSILPKEVLNGKGHHWIFREVSNNYGELLAFKYALQIADRKNIKKIFGDSKLIIDYWSKWKIKKEVGAETVALAREVAKLREDFEKGGGEVQRISGGSNPADLGFHRN